MAQFPTSTIQASRQGGLAYPRELPFEPDEDREEFAPGEVLNPGASSPPASLRIGFGA